jgi:beta-glucosidase
LDDPRARNKLQQRAIKESRLGIPLIFGFDTIHGLRTVFPIPLAISCAWDPDLFQALQVIAARERAGLLGSTGFWTDVRPFP